MPKLSLFNTIFREPWMIDPQTAAAQRQVLCGVLMGLEFTPENEAIQAAIGHDKHPEIPQGKTINVIHLEGTMLRDDAGCGLYGTRTLARELKKADADSEVIGHILRIDSGGGAANSVPDLAEAIQSCQKPVLAFVDGYMCSAAMYAGSYCGYIMANRGDDRVGCIGTMVQIADWPKNARDNNGMVHLRVYADGSEEKNSEYESALEGDFRLVKERMLNPLNEQFKADIRKNRPAVNDDQLTGRTYFARDAVGTLIDSLGDFDAAVAKVVELSNLNIIKMDGLTYLQQTPSCADLQMVDGVVSLNQEQLEAIDNRFRDCESRNQEHERTISEQVEENNRLEQENAALRSSNETQAAEITALRATVTELSNKPTPPAQSAHNGDPVTEQYDNENPEEFCRNIIERHNG